MVKLLLGHGANPNLPDHTTWTPWQLVLWNAGNAGNSSKSEMIHVFLESNADPRITVRNLSADAMIKKAFQSWNQAKTKDFFCRLAELRKTQ